MNTIIINGKRYETNGKNISVVNNTIKVDGVLIADGLSGEVSVKFEGDLASLNASNVTLNGNVYGDVDCTNLDIHGNIEKDVDCTSLEIKGDIKGNVDATSIEIEGNIVGKVKATTVSHK